MQRAVDQAEQRGLARAVAPDQADFFAGIDGDGDAVQQHLHAAAKGEILQEDHARQRSCSSSPPNSTPKWLDDDALGALSNMAGYQGRNAQALRDLYCFRRVGGSRYKAKPAPMFSVP